LEQQANITDTGANNNGNEHSLEGSSLKKEGIERRERVGKAQPSVSKGMYNGREGTPFLIPPHHLEMIIDISHTICYIL
jgi:hypothetical protein